MVGSRIRWAVVGRRPGIFDPQERDVPKQFIFSYTVIGNTCMVDKKHMAQLLKALKGLGIESKNIPTRGIRKSRQKSKRAARK